MGMLYYGFITNPGPQWHLHGVSTSSILSRLAKNVGTVRLGYYIRHFRYGWRAI
jgi:hypothetical protein